MTFDVQGKAIHIETESQWQYHYEVFCLCRACGKTTVFQLAHADPEYAGRGSEIIASDANLNHLFEVVSFVSLKDRATQNPPEHVAKDVARAFREAATCMAVQCWNAAGAMFRASVDLATRAMLPPLPGEGKQDAEGLNKRVRRDLGLRLQWLFDNKKLPEDLRELSKCIREDANDGVHAVTLGKPDAEDLLDFTEALLERIYTEPEKLKLAEQRRTARRAGEGTPTRITKP